jgi:hypothetical protein
LSFELSRPTFDPTQVSLTEAPRTPASHEQQTPLADGLHHHRRQARKQRVKFISTWVVLQIHKGDKPLTHQGLPTDRPWNKDLSSEQSASQEDSLSVVQQKNGRGSRRQKHGAPPAQLRNHLCGQTLCQVQALLSDEGGSIGR